MMNQTLTQAENELYLTLLNLRPHFPIVEAWLATLPAWLSAIKDKRRYAHAPLYQSIIERLPVVGDRQVYLDRPVVGVAFDWSEAEFKRSLALLRQLMPWRKGPFALGALDEGVLESAHFEDVQTDLQSLSFIHADRQIFIDTEWRSDWKWQRVLPHIRDLRHKRVLDVGGGSGYHGWRMAGAGANTVMVIDPSCLFYHQFMSIRHFVGEADRNDFGQLRVHYLPVGLEALPFNSQLFDTVFSMGVLYHRAAPFEHLLQLKSQLKSGGELVLETLVIDGDAQSVLVPKDRYAQMNNVYFLPSVPALQLWLEKVGFVNVRCVDVSITTTDEQRQTPFMAYHSLADFLDRSDPSQTLEGYPAPMRAVMVASKPK